MTDATLFRLAALATLVSSAWAAYQIYKQHQGQTIINQLADLQSATQGQAAFVIPSQNPTDPGFSNYARRLDVFAPLDLADQPLAYGQVIPL